MTFAEAEQLFLKELNAIYEPEEAKNLFCYSIEHLAGIQRIAIIADKQQVISERNEASLLLILEELKTGKPIQYILGETEFYGLRLKVNPGVLIPRPETEELVDWVLKEVEVLRSEVGDLRSDLGKGFKILDIGTGSGCIPIALKKHIPEAEVFGLDVSADALESAMRNAVFNGTEVKFVLGDILEAVSYQPSAISSLPFNVIISNPPYITQKEKVQMHTNVLEHEPHLALFVPDENPLLFYIAIADFAKKHLENAGMLFLEINETYGSEIVSMLEGKGFSEIELRKDMQGKDRMVKAEVRF